MDVHVSPDDLMIELRRPVVRVALTALGLMLIGIDVLRRAAFAGRLPIQGLREGAIVVFGAATVAAACITTLAWVRLLRRAEFRIVVTNSIIVLPRYGLGGEDGDASIPFRDVLAIRIEPYAAPSDLVISTRVGVFRVPGAWLPDERAVTDLAMAIVQRMQRTHARTQEALSKK